MPGYSAHLAATKKESRENISFLIGVEMPDILKAFVRKYTLEGARQKYNEIKTKDMPDFSYFEKRVQEKDDKLEKGMHYGSSDVPNIHSFWDSLTIEEKNNPFYRGYLWHLLTDFYAYQTLKIFSGVDINLLHADWDRINVYIKKAYPDLEMTKEIKELNLLSYIDDNVFNYVDPVKMMQIIEYLNKFDMLNGDPSAIISEITNKIKENKLNIE